DHEIGIVTVMANDVHRRHDLIAVKIVGDREHGRDEIDIGLTACLEDLLTVAARWKTTRIEAALRADRHDDAVLHLLCLDEAEHLRAVVLSTIGPAQAAARDRPEAQMHALHFRTIDEDLAPGARLWQPFDRTAVELEGKRATPAFGEIIG